MNRDMKKAIEEYKKISSNNSRRCMFFYSDIKQLVDSYRNIVDGVIDGLMAGFAIGYKAGRKDQKEGRR